MRGEVRQEEVLEFWLVGEELFEFPVGDQELKGLNTMVFDADEEAIGAFLDLDLGVEAQVEEAEDLELGLKLSLELR